MAKKKAAKKTAAKKTSAKKKTTRKKKAEAGTRGLTPGETQDGEIPDQVAALVGTVQEDGGFVIATYRDPLGGAWQLFVSLPLERIKPAPFQRDLSDTHVKNLAKVLDRLDRYLDPIIVVRTLEGEYWTPNGYHRTAALARLGARSVHCLLIPEFEIAYQILALNTEKAPDLKARSLEVIRLARALSALAPAKESDYAIQFDDEAGLLTLGGCYEIAARFSGSSYRPILKRADDFLDADLGEALETRALRAKVLVEIDEIVSAHIKVLKDRGAQSQYIRNVVVAAVNPLRGGKGKADFDETFETMRAKVDAFDPEAFDLRKLGG